MNNTNQNLNIFIDESGNTGSILVDESGIKDFHGQPYFVLGSFGLFNNEIDRLTSKILRLKKEYKINTQELKGIKIYKKNPEFAYHILSCLFSLKHPIFIELVDKKYFLSTNIIESVVFPVSANIPPTKETRYIKNYIADYLYYHLSDSIYIKFCDACKNFNLKKWKCFYNSISKELESLNDNISEGILVNIQESYEDYKLMVSQEPNHPVHERFLPYPDRGKKNEILALLPHTPSFSNICARTEKYRMKNKIEKISYIHDNQCYFDDILKTNFSFLKSLQNNFLLPDEVIERHKFNLINLSKLDFKSSTNTLMIQIADIISGITYKTWKDFRNGVKLNKYIINLFKKIIFNYEFLDNCLGINFVVTKYEHNNFINMIQYS